MGRPSAGLEGRLLVHRGKGARGASAFGLQVERPSCACRSRLTAVRLAVCVYVAEGNQVEPVLRWYYWATCRRGSSVRCWNLCDSSAGLCKAALLTVLARDSASGGREPMGDGIPMSVIVSQGAAVASWKDGLARVSFGRVGTCGCRMQTLVRIERGPVVVREMVGPSPALQLSRARSLQQGAWRRGRRKRRPGREG